MTDDFVNDAIDSLEKDKELTYLLVAAHQGADNSFHASCVSNRKQLEWLRKRLVEALDRIENRIKQKEL